MGNPGNLGAAQGSIQIDISQLQAAQVAVRNAAQQMNQAMASTGQGARQAQNNFANLSGTLSQLGGAFGIAFGAAGIAQLTRAVASANEMATAYSRQRVAAVNLAGSQAQLNDLLDTYETAVGGSVSRVAALESVTKLMSVGFADSVQELDRFARAIRGISVAMGKSEDFVTQNLILELFSQRGMRLDQLGLQYDKVRAAADALRASDASLTQEQAYQNAVLQQAEQRFGALTDSAEGQKTGMENLGAAWDDFMLEFGNQTRGGTNFFGDALANWLNDNTKAMQRFGDVTLFVAQALGLADRTLDSWGGGSSGMSISDRTRGNVATPTSTPFGDEQNQAVVEWFRATQDIERQANRDRVEATRQYEQQRTETIRQYEKTIAREAQDFAISRARSEQDYQQSLVSFRRNIDRRELRAAEDLASTLAQTRADNSERLQRIDDDYQRSRLQAMRRFTDSLTDAAGRLDAKAVAEAQRNFLRDQQERKEAYEQQLTDTKSQYDKTTRQAQEAADLQLRRAREDDEQRLSDMVADMQLRRERENEDRALRLERLAQDHQDQLDEQARQHELRLQQIDDQAAEELQRTNDAFDDQMIALKVHNDLVKQRQDDFQAEAFISYGKYLDAQKAELEARTTASQVAASQSVIGARSPAIVPVPGGGTVTNSRSTSVSGVNINVYAAPGQSAYDIAAAVDERLFYHLEQLGK